MKRIRTAASLILIVAMPRLAAQTAFQSYSAQGDNLIHIATADFDGVGKKDHIVTMTVSGKVIAFERLEASTDPAAPVRRWEYDGGPTFGIMLETGEAISSSPGEEVLLPGTDGRLRILSRDGILLADWELETVPTGARPGPLYSVDTGVNEAGDIRIVAGGVDGRIYILDENGNKLSSTRPPGWGVIRRVVVGNFDGIGGDEVMAFYNRANFAGNTFAYPIDLDSLSVPGYWGSNAAIDTDVARSTSQPYTSMGWTDNQLLHAYDMDGDGDEDIVAHWGVFHPEDGYRTGLLSTTLRTGEGLQLEDYTNLGETNTGKYILQQGVPGEFREGTAYPGPEMFTIYGDDLYLVDYDLNASAAQRFRVTDYAYAHSLYSFTDVARLEDRDGGLDKVVVTGPINGEDRFHLIDLNGTAWKNAAKTIDNGGTLVTVRATLDTLQSQVAAFATQSSLPERIVAEEGKPIWFVHYFASSLGWNMSELNIRRNANGVRNAMQEWSDKLFGAGYQPKRIRWAASLSLKSNGGTIDPDITDEGLVAFCAALAERGVYFCLNIGHGQNVEVSPELLADCFQASVIDGNSFLMARTKELRETTYIDVYKPHMDAVMERAASMGVAPPKIMLCGKGAIFSAMTPAKAATYFPAYKDVFTPGVENSNVTVLEWSFAERVGLWLNGDVESWGCNPIGDNLAANRVAEWGGMTNGHVILRQLLSQYAMGAEFFRITSIGGKDNPMYPRDISDPEYEWSNAYRQGIANFLRIVEHGIYPNGPERHQLKGISPVAAALPTPSFARLRDQGINHDYYKYSPQPQDYVINSLACWYAYRDVPDTDLTAIMHGTQRRWDNLLPTSPSGFVPMIPYSTRAAVEAKDWNRRTFETDGDSWGEFGGDLDGARDTIAAELIAQRTNLDFYVENECFWQVTAQAGDPDTLFAVLMDSSILSPSDRSVQLKRGSAEGTWEVFDQLGSITAPIGTLRNGTDAVSIDIPAGAVRLLVLRRKDLSYEGWATANQLSGSEALAFADPEADGFSNWLEFALGGNPMADDNGLLDPAAFIENAEGTDYYAYHYRRRTDRAERALIYTVEVSSTLEADSWITDGVSEFSVTPIDPNFESVSVRTPVPDGEPKFIRLKIEDASNP